MSETEITESPEILDPSIQEKFKIQNKDAILQIILVAVLGGLLYLAVEMIEMPYLAFGLIPLGLDPSLAIG